MNSFGLFVVPSVYSCLVSHEVHQFVAWSQSPNFVPGRLAHCLRSQSLESEHKLWELMRFEEERSVKQWATFYLDLHYIMHTIIHQGHERFSVLSRGRSAMLFHEPVRLVR